MSGCDIAIAGGGLSGGLIALALKRAHPELNLVVVDADVTLGGNHRWSWFESDLPADGKGLLASFPHTKWEHGYEVRFPAYRRRLETPYRSLSSTDFHATLCNALPADTLRIGTRVAALDSSGITLENGERIAARAVIDCRGFEPTPLLTGGWQVFLGRHVRTDGPHKLDRPIIMDATVEQFGGFRFVYCLPLRSDELFVEDTYYADQPLLDRRILSERLDAYCAQQGWAGQILGEETGVLPVVTGGDFPAWQASQGPDAVACAGVRGGFWHPLTSYTLPFATEIALLVAKNAELPGPELARLLAEKARQHWSATRFYRLLGRMLFRASEPTLRYRVLERFYRLPPFTVERLYAGRSTPADRRRILCGKPPVPVMRAIAALLDDGRPLEAAE